MCRQGPGGADRKDNGLLPSSTTRREEQIEKSIRNDVEVDIVVGILCCLWLGMAIKYSANNIIGKAVGGKKPAK